MTHTDIHAHMQCKTHIYVPRNSCVYTEESQDVEVERHTLLQYTKFKNQLVLRMMNCKYAAASCVLEPR